MLFSFWIVIIMITIVLGFYHFLHYDVGKVVLPVPQGNRTYLYCKCPKDLEPIPGSWSETKFQTESTHIKAGVRLTVMYRVI